jgi:hypothetical protein
MYGRSGRAQHDCILLQVKLNLLVAELSPSDAKAVTMQLPELPGKVKM